MWQTDFLTNTVLSRIVYLSGTKGKKKRDGNWISQIKEPLRVRIAAGTELSPAYASPVFQLRTDGNFQK